ncbi:MAG TPA: hypothetical protein VFG53_20575 [Anaeromyxobacter sp.]|nr:hypothetical protein [Anaeromyxobacter sp.]
MTPLAAPYQGGRRLALLSALSGGAGLVVLALGGLAFDGRRALYAYLVAFTYWLGIAVGALILLSAFHASNARWPVVLRRFVEHVPAVIPLFVVLFLPILFGRHELFPWTLPESLEGELRHLVEHKRPYLNLPFFVVRAAFYFASWVGVAELLRRWSLRQDASGGITLTRWQRRLGAGSLPLLALTLSFAAFDWIMSVDPRFYSTIFGVYWFSGSFLATFAVVIIAAALTQKDPTQFGSQMSAEHFHSLGKFLLAFTAFWAYIAFSQLLLIWIANVPEEVPWLALRIQGGWLYVGLFLVVFQFLVPFFLLLSRDLKRNPRTLAWVSGWVLLAHFVDMYWLVMPHLDRAGPRPSLFDLAAFVGVGGVTVAFALLRMRGWAAVPVKDPYLPESLRYLPP